MIAFALAAFLCIVNLSISPPSPFYDANFVSLPAGSVALFSNPAGLGLNTGAELMAAYNIGAKVYRGGITVRNIGFGAVKEDSVTHYEGDIGVRLPGAFAFGYAYEFHDTSEHKLGFLCRTSPKLSLGFTTTLAVRKYINGSISIKPLEQYLILSADISYEGIDDTVQYYFGAALQTTQGSKLFFCTDRDLKWHAGLDITFAALRVAASYTKEPKKFSVGAVFNAPVYQ